MNVSSKIGTGTDSIRVKNMTKCVGKWQTRGVPSILVVNCHKVNRHFTMLLIEKGGGDFFTPTLLQTERSNAPSLPMQPWGNYTQGTQTFDLISLLGKIHLLEHFVFQWRLYRGINGNVCFNMTTAWQIHYIVVLMTLLLCPNTKKVREICEKVFTKVFELLTVIRLMRCYHWTF